MVVTASSLCLDDESRLDCSGAKLAEPSDGPQVHMSRLNSHPMLKYEVGRRVVGSDCSKHGALKNRNERLELYACWTP
jgi:hypothetical protein